MDIVDFETDCLDPASHLNPSGGRKVTDYLGKYIIENYDIKDRRDDINYAEWHNDYQEAVQYKLNKIKELDSLDKYLCMLADKNLNSCIYINEQEILQDERMRKLLENISLNSGLEKINEYQESDKGYFLLVDNNNRQIHEYLGENDIKITTSFGTVEYSNDFEIGAGLKINGSEYFDKEADVQIVLIDGISGEVKDSVSFVLDEKQTYVGATVLR